MFAIGIHYLNGWSMAAADGARKEKAEWPPHPDRVFMALAAAWFETGEDVDEGKVLRWVESLPPPSIAATEATNRIHVVSYVPVNDIRVGRKIPDGINLDKLKKAGLTVLPEYRLRQPRSFPVAIPIDPTVYLVWPKAKLDLHRDVLKRLATKVTHVGHSASLVHAWVEEDSDITPTWEPKEGFTKHRLRIPITGRLDNLIQTYNKSEVLEYAELNSRVKTLKGKEKKHLKNLINQRFGSRVPVSLRPKPSRWQGYDRPDNGKPDEEIGSIFDPNLVVLAIKGKNLSLPSTLKLIQAARGALMSSCHQQPPPEWVSGHRDDGAPTTQPHLAMFPLSFVGVPYADSRIMGLALALPRNLDAREAEQYLERFLYNPDTGLPSECRLFDAQWLECTVELETRERPPKNLDSYTWTRPSHVWASVTPVVLNRHFRGKEKWKQAAESIKQACIHVGLPSPRKVSLHPTSIVEGAPHSKEYPQLVRKSDGGRQSHSHAVIIFDEAVRGPVLVGAGRFRGYGLFRPMDGNDLPMFPATRASAAIERTGISPVYGGQICTEEIEEGNYLCFLRRGDGVEVVFGRGETREAALLSAADNAPRVATAISTGRQR